MLYLFTVVLCFFLLGLTLNLYVVVTFGSGGGGKLEKLAEGLIYGFGAIGVAISIFMT